MAFIVFHCNTKTFFRVSSFVFHRRPWLMDWNWAILRSVLSKFGVQYHSTVFISYFTITSKSTLQRLLDLAGLRYTTSEKSGPSWQSMLHNFLSRPLSFLGWTTAMLFWLDFHQTQSNLYKWFRMQRHDWSSTSPKEPMLHLSSSHCTGYQWQLASSSRHWCLHTERPQAQHPPTSTHYYESTSPPEVWDLLVSDALRYHHREAQNHSPEHSHSPFLDGGIIFPPLSGMLDPCQSSSNNWKLISFGTTWLQPKLVQRKKKKKNFPFIFLSFPC